MDLEFERRHWAAGRRFIAGIDEAGRGPLAGPVVAAAVIFPEDGGIDGVDDSKKLTARERERLFDLIRGGALSIGIGIVPHDDIDRLNIFQATMKAMRDAVDGLSLIPDHLLVDGPRFDGGSIPSTPIIDGDAKCYTIAAASIIAKVTRDRIMVEYDRRFPVYGFARHKGYGTPEHLAALKKYGPCEIHRRSFRMPGKDAS
ncbi:MAG TPA: ribonuclease HII [Bacteroidota bacterium]|nr:ribonuclease HII [Bacteroidota bacterium]